MSANRMTTEEAIERHNNESPNCPERKLRRGGMQWVRCYNCGWSSRREESYVPYKENE